MTSLQPDAASLRSAFKDVSDVQVDDAFEQKCMSMCAEFELSAQDLVAEFELIAVRLTNHDQEHLLRKLEEKLRKTRDVKRRKSASSQGMSTPISGARTTKRLAGQSRRVKDEFMQVRTVQDYANRTTPPSGMKRAKQNDGTPRISNTTTPPSVTKKYSERSDMGKAMLKFNETLELIQDPSEEESAIQPKKVQITQLVKPEKYMYYTMEERSQALEEQLLDAKERFKSIHGWSDDDFVATGSVTQESALVVGRIWNEAPEGRLNSESLLLEGSRAESSGIRVKLDVKSVAGGYALFPGQIVVVRGTCPDRHTLFASEIFSDLEPTPCAKPRAEAFEDCKGIDRPLSMFVAAGPYTTKDNLEYEPLEDLLASAKEAKADVLILMGPFIDIDHPQVASGECCKTLPSGEVIKLTYRDLFELVILQRIDFVLKDSPTRVVLVPSLRDVHHNPSFPQPPFKDINHKQLNIEQGKIIMASNPCMLSIDGINVAINTQDIVKHLAAGNEVYASGGAKGGGKRVERLTGHLLKQGSFYPLFPPPAEARLDFIRYPDFELKQTPDVMLFSSVLQYFCYEIDGCLCVHPAKLTRGSTGGLYAKLYVGKRTAEQVEQTLAKQAKRETGGDDSNDDVSVPNDVPARTQVEILRI